MCTAVKKCKVIIMPKRTGPSDPNVVDLIHQLKKLSSESNVMLWKTVAEKLEKPRRQRASVNLSKINRYTKENEIALIPGTVLSAGKLDHPVTIAALKFSTTAKEKIEQSNCKWMSISDLIKSNPSGNKIKILV